MLLNQERLKMQKNSLRERKLRTRTLIQLGGLVQKAGLMETFNIRPGDDLQEYENLRKAAQLLGFLINAGESETFTEIKQSEFEKRGERMLRYI